MVGQEAEVEVLEELEGFAGTEHGLHKRQQQGYKGQGKRFWVV